MDTKATGSPPESFAREAWKAIIDIDIHELNKYDQTKLDFDCKIHSDLNNFLKSFKKVIISNTKKIPNFDNWLNIISTWKIKYNPILESKIQNLQGINPYELFSNLSDHIGLETSVFVDTGCAIAWVMQAFKIKGNQRIFHDFNNTAMGWALPASLAGASFQKHKKTICITGDGSFMMNIQELATIKYLKLPVIILIINNEGYSMIKQTQEQWLNSNYVASSKEKGLWFPDFEKVANAFSISFFNYSSDKDEILFRKLLKSKLDGPLIIDIKINSNWRVTPQVKFGRPNEDPDPILDRNTFAKEMLIKTIS